MSGWGYCDAKAFKRFGAIFLVIRRTAPDSLGGDCLRFFIGRLLALHIELHCLREFFWADEVIAARGTLGAWPR